MRRASWAVPFCVGACLGVAVAAPARRLDRYGGYPGLRGHNTSGFFRVEKIEDRYYLVTPDNHAFISLAFDTANFHDGWGGRCPTLDSYPNPYGNRAKYNNDKKAWEGAIKANMARWGFNGFGAWCQQGVPQVVENVRVLFVTNRAYALKVAKIGRDFPDVFDPEFAQAADEQAKSLAPHADSRYRIGAFPDNELGWVGADYWGKTGAPPLPDAFIALPPAAHGKQYWANAFLPGKYATIDKLNEAYGTSFRGFDGEGNTLINAAKLPNDPDHPAIFEDKKDFCEAIAEKYYRVVTAAMRKHDPNHLVFSARWALWTTAFDRKFAEHQAYNERIWKKAGEYCDVIAINTYHDNRALEAHHKLFSRMFKASGGKPFMITEWATLADDTQFEKHKGWRRYQRDRGDFYVEQMKVFMDFAFESPGGGKVHPCLGAQWFQYYDEPSLGRTDGEKANFGLLNVKDEPYVTALDVMASFNARWFDYAVHGKPLELLDAPKPASPTAKGKDGKAEPATLETGRPRFAWSDVAGAASYTLLYSPEKCFPEAQTVRIDGIEECRHEPEHALPPGLWYWCARGVDAKGRGGKYSGPVPFRVHPPTSAAKRFAYLGFEDLSAWQNVSLEDGGWDGVTWAFRDTEHKTTGRSSARVQFTMNSINKQTGAVNARKGEIVWRYVGPRLRYPKAGQVSFDVMPHRATDSAGEMTVASRYASLRLADTDGNVVLDTRIDPEGALTPLQWQRLSFPLAGPLERDLGMITFYVDLAVEGIPWDQRLVLWLDKLAITRAERGDRPARR